MFSFWSFIAPFTIAVAASVFLVYQAQLAFNDNSYGSDFGSSSSFNQSPPCRPSNNSDNFRPSCSRRKSRSGSGRGTSHNTKCVICYEEMTSDSTILPCGHGFDASCLTRWISSGRNTCPLCRTQF